MSGGANAQLPDGNWAAISSMATVNEIVRTGDIIWAATNGGVLQYSLDSRAYERFTRVDGLAGNRVLSAVADSEDNLWFGTGGGTPGGVSRYDGETWTTFTTEDGLAYDWISSILRDRNGKLCRSAMTETKAG